VIAVLDQAAAMSAATRKFDSNEGVDVMTSTVVFHSTPAARRARPHGLDRLVMRLSLAMLLWARRRADRGMLTHEEQALRRANALVIERNTGHYRQGVSRIF